MQPAITASTALLWLAADFLEFFSSDGIIAIWALSSSVCSCLGCLEVSHRLKRNIHGLFDLHFDSIF